MRDRELRARLEVGWKYVRPGGIRARDRRYVARFLELLGDYEEVQDWMKAMAPDEGEIDVLVWPGCGEWILDRVWERPGSMWGATRPPTTPREGTSPP